MSWTTPKTWSYKEAPGSESLNIHLRDNLNYLKEALPPGIMLPYGGATAPDQWLLCDGSAVSRSTYSDLFAILGTAYGTGNGSTTFNLPDYRGRVMVGLKSTDANFDAMGETGGASTHTLTEAEMPVHNHAVTDTGHEHGVRMTWSGGNDPVGGNRQICTDSDTISGPGTSSYAHAISATTGISINNAGSGNAHNNLQPYQVSNFIIKY